MTVRFTADTSLNKLVIQFAVGAILVLAILICKNMIADSVQKDRFQKQKSQSMKCSVSTYS